MAICDLDEGKCASVCHQLVNKYGKDRAIFCECDVTDYPQFEEAFQTIIETYGRLDAVVNNAGVMNDRLWELEVDVNLVCEFGKIICLNFLCFLSERSDSGHAVGSADHGQGSGWTRRRYYQYWVQLQCQTLQQSPDLLGNQACCSWTHTRIRGKNLLIVCFVENFLL